MSIANVISLLGGLALFLYGMQMMSQGLENAAGNKMKRILERLTSNRFLGVLVGTVITAVIQSSSATTVMVVGFVNSGMMTLNQAVWIIMGANIGTTVTGQLIALDAGIVAPLIAFIGVAMILFLKKEKSRHFGNILAGLGILFIGMDMMSLAMKPLSSSEQFISILTKFQNPLLGIFAGAVFTAVIQSSSASVGILQALAASGIVTLDTAAYILFGQNIGTCITAFLASIGTSKNAKRTTIIHITFNCIGTVIFTFLCLKTPLIMTLQRATPANVPGQIANLHTLFNIVTTILLLPFGTYLTKFAAIVLPDGRSNATVKDETLQHMLTMENKMQQHGRLSEKEMLGQSAISFEETQKEIRYMMSLAKSNIHNAFEVFLTGNKQMLGEIQTKEEEVDQLNSKISRFITTAVLHETTKDGSKVFHSYFIITGNIERVSDHAMNIAEYSKMCEEMGASFSREAEKEVKYLQQTCDKLFEALETVEDDVMSWHGKIAGMEQKNDDITKQYRNHMFERMKQEICSYQGGILYSEMLTDFERIGDHALNIADEIKNIALVNGN